MGWRGDLHLPIDKSTKHFIKPHISIMQLRFSVPILLCLLPLCALSSVAQTFDFYYFVQQWPGSYCDTKQGCCYPKSGKPASDFIIYGLQPYSNLGSPLLNCDARSPLDPSKLSNLTPLLQKHWPSLACPAKDEMKHWSNEWTKHGTCSKSLQDQQRYFQAAINLKKKVNLLQILKNAGIEPNGKLSSVSDISEAIRKSVGHEPGIQCNLDKAGNSQLNMIYLCTNTQGSVFVECPGLPTGTCKTTIKFPAF